MSTVKKAKKERFLNPSTFGAKVKAFLTSTEGSFENAKHAWAEFCKVHPDTNPSQLWFYTLFTQFGKKETKETKIANFLKTLEPGSVSQAMAAYKAFDPTVQISNVYFQTLFGRHGNKAVKVKKTATPKGKTVKLSEMTAKAAIEFVAANTKQTITTSAKNKVRVMREAKTILEAKGFKVKA